MQLSRVTRQTCTQVLTIFAQNRGFRKINDTHACHCGSTIFWINGSLPRPYFEYYISKKHAMYVVEINF